MLLRLLHRTTFTYAGKAHDSFNEVRLKPVTDIDQACVGFTLRTEPNAEAREYTDFYGNTVHYFDISEGHRKLVVEATSEVQTVPDEARRPVPSVPLSALEGEAAGSHAEFMVDSHYVPLDVSLWREAQDALVDGRGDIWSDVRRLGQHVYRTMAYRPRSTGVGTRATDALKLRMGVCQDFAHVAIGLCRCSGIPARYVSGYFLNRSKRPNENEASHAWMEAFVPGYGWAAFDPTHDRPANERYVKVAAGRDYADIRPVSGTYRGAKTRSLRVDVKVRHEPAPLDAVH